MCCRVIADADCATGNQFEVLVESFRMTTTSVLDLDLAHSKTTQNINNDNETFEATVRIVVPIVFGLVTVVGLVGNLLVIAVALRHKTRNTTNVLIVGLAVADLVAILSYLVLIDLYIVLVSSEVLCLSRTSVLVSLLTAATHLSSLSSPTSCS